MQTYEEQKAFVSKLNIIDDVFFQKIAEDREVVEEMLRIILEKPKLRVIESKVQHFLRNIGAHSVVLDLICEDENHCTKLLRNGLRTLSYYVTLSLT